MAAWRIADDARDAVGCLLACLAGRREDATTVIVENMNLDNLAAVGPPTSPLTVASSSPPQSLPRSRAATSPTPTPTPTSGAAGGFAPMSVLPAEAADMPDLTALVNADAGAGSPDPRRNAFLSLDTPPPSSVAPGVTPSSTPGRVGADGERGDEAVPGDGVSTPSRPMSRPVALYVHGGDESMGALAIQETDSPDALLYSESSNGSMVLTTDSETYASGPRFGGREVGFVGGDEGDTSPDSAAVMNTARAVAAHVNAAGAEKHARTARVASASANASAAVPGGLAGPRRIGAGGALVSVEAEGKGERREVVGRGGEALEVKEERVLDPAWEAAHFNAVASLNNLAVLLCEQGERMGFASRDRAPLARALFVACRALMVPRSFLFFCFFYQRRRDGVLGHVRSS